MRVIGLGVDFGWWPVVLDGGLLCSVVLAAALFYRDAGVLI